MGVSELCWKEERGVFLVFRFSCFLFLSFFVFEKRKNK